MLRKIAERKKGIKTNASKRLNKKTSDDEEIKLRHGAKNKIIMINQKGKKTVYQEKAEGKLSFNAINTTNKIRARGNIYIVK